ncbi:Smr/MutS family protein [Spirochaeta cellobiosiphila]|uniref:Smr/MutS family protein n=1 Tax=Spirochaeta cellobiosiphila TaxID=504483 RepID=UPI00042A56AA|nr:Smr/MutS family protein [Spirochaeta cellobiosiphila]
MSKNSDFGDILDQWIKTSTSQKPVLPTKNSKTKKAAKHEQMMDWIDRNPIHDKDAGLTPQVRNTSPHPEKWKVEDVIDLHGYTAKEAEAKLAKFLLRSKRKGYRKVYIIHGKGKHSQEEGVLKDMVRRYLEKSTLIGKTGHPPNKDGGTGVTWAALR